MPNGFLIYSGPSEIDGAPVIVVATGFATPSANRKTGSGLIQTWILRADISPVQAIHTGADYSICGSCSLRGVVTDGRITNRACYVVVMRAPLSVWKVFARSYTADKSAGLSAARERVDYASVSEAQIATLFAGRGVRIGAYGDPAAVPPRIWEAVTERATFWTGYTHQWRTCDPIFARWCMASCETVDERLEAHARGYRTFRTTLRDPNSDRLAREIVCPASVEAGRKTTCERCRVCGGTAVPGRQPDVVIAMHRWAPANAASGG